jgi:hypothetical protein
MSTPTTFKLGKKPARPNAVAFRLATFQTGEITLPPVPRSFGTQAPAKPWGMYGNDQYGDCVWAGAAHEHRVFRLRDSGADIPFTSTQVLADYAAATGFSKDDPGSDQGTDMEEAAKYRRKTGIRGPKGTRHKIGAYLALNPQNLAQLKQAAWLYGAVGVGIRFPDTAMQQFNAGQPWSVAPGARLQGGHYVPLVGFDGTHFLVVTWGRLQKVDHAFLYKYADEALVYVSEDLLGADKVSPQGLNVTQLQQELARL